MVGMGASGDQGRPAWQGKEVSTVHATGPAPLPVLGLPPGHRSVAFNVAAQAGGGWQVPQRKHRTIGRHLPMNFMAVCFRFLWGLAR